MALPITMAHSSGCGAGPFTASVGGETHHGALGYHGTRRYHLTAAPGRSKDTPRRQSAPIGDPSAALPRHTQPRAIHTGRQNPTHLLRPTRWADPTDGCGALVQVSAVRDLDVERGEDALIEVRPSPAGDDARGTAPAYFGLIVTQPYSGGLGRGPALVAASSSTTW